MIFRKNTGIFQTQMKYRYNNMKKIAAALLLLTAILFSMPSCASMSRYYGDFTETFGKIVEKNAENEAEAERGTEEPLTGTGSGSATEDITKLEINWFFGKVEIGYADCDFIRFSEEYDGNLVKYPMTYEQKNGVLKLSCGTGDGVLNRSGNIPSLSKTLKVDIPSGTVLEELDVGKASVEINGVSAECVKILSVSGNVSVSGVSSDKVDIYSGFGEVVLGDADIKELKAESVNSEITVSAANTPGNVTLKSVSGKIGLLLPEEAGFEVRAKTVSGTFSSDFELVTVGNLHTRLGGENSYVIETVSGDIEVNKNTVAEQAEQAE